MIALSFVAIAFMLSAYVLTDGYDLGVAAVSPAVAKTQREREALMACIGPFWNGNEVWLVAAGASLFALFPLAYAAAFSGFYLPFIIVLWLLMFRGIAMELRGHFPSRLWHDFWDAAFTVSSGLLVFIFGVALGNLLRGLPLTAQGYFQGTFAYLLNPYALLVGVFALAVLCLHGAAFAAMRIDGGPGTRAKALLAPLTLVTLVLYAVVTGGTYLVRGGWPHTPLALVFATIAPAALGALWLASRRSARAAFAASSCFVAALLATAAATIYPYLLPASAGGGISIFDAAPSAAASLCALVVTIGGSAATLTYGSFVWRRMAGKVRVEEQAP